MADPEEYRTKEQVEEWRQRDPIETFGGAARGRGRARRGGARSSSTRRPSRASTRPSRFADASPHPAPESLYDDIYVLGGQVRGWWSLDERTPSPHRGEDERGMAPPTWARRSPYEAAVRSMAGDTRSGGGGPADARGEDEAG